MDSQYWDNEEFEDHVASALVAMYETKIKKSRGSIKATRVSEDILNRIKLRGCYFPARDRIMAATEGSDGALAKIQQIDVINDERPEYAIYCRTVKDLDKCDYESMSHGSYLEISYLERINDLPKPFKCNFSGKKYRLVNLWMRNEGFIEGICLYVVIDHNGYIYGCYRIEQNVHPITGLTKKEIVDAAVAQSREESNRCEDLTTFDASSTIQYWQDRRYLWNVIALEGKAKCTFAVYPEEIKSLFYARSLPMSETGRKRPILHWVASHHRRLKNGTDIDVEKHLRGINEFVYNDTKFMITRPIKTSRH